MSWEMQVRIIKMENNKPVKKFCSVKCSGKDGYTYRYKTELEARQSLDSCYGHAVPNKDLRVIEVDKPANISHK